MRKATTLLLAATFILAGDAYSQRLEYVFSPEGSDISDPFAVGVQNGARGLSGPYDLDGDGKLEVLIAQHTAGGRVHVIENQGVDEWELVYSTPVLDPTGNSFNARYAIGTDLDGDGLGEIVYVAGTGYAGTDPVLTIGAYVFEYDGQGSDNYGDYPASIANFYEIDPNLGTNSNIYVQKLAAADIDGDDVQELLIPANGSAGTHDVFYVLSVTGELETGQAASSFVAWNIESRHNPRDSNDIWGGGSAYDMIPADMNGDGQMDISYHSWNYFNFFNGTVAEPNRVTLAEAGTPDPHIWASHPDDHVSLFGGVAGDIDGDGNDEVFYPNWNSGNVTVIDFDQGDDVLSIPASKLGIEIIPLIGTGGAAIGDLDNDEAKELMVGGPGYSGTSYTRGEPSRFIRIAEYLGGDPKLGASYEVHALDTGDPIDSTGFAVVHRDSAGVDSTYYATISSKASTTAISAGDPVFASGIAYLGDADGDGNIEVAISFQGIDDSLQVVDEVWNADSLRYDRTVRETVAAPVRPFLRIYEFAADFCVAVEDRPGGLPTGFTLHQNYPNPFNPTTTITYALPRDEVVNVRVYDITGRVVKTLVNSQLQPRGSYQATWDGTNSSGESVASGTYFYSLEIGGQRVVKGMVLAK